MRTIVILTMCILLSVTAACAPGPASNPAPSATPSPAPTAQPAATSLPTSEPTTPPAAGPTVIPVVEEGVGAISKSLELPNQGGLFPAFGAGSVWIPGQGLLTRIDPGTLKVVSKITLDGGKHIPGPPYAVAVDGDSIWATELRNKALVRIDPATNEIVDRIELGIEGELHAMVLDGSILWVAVRGANQILQVDTATRRIIRSIPVSDPTGIAIGEGSVWAVEHRKGNLVRIDPDTGTVTATIQLLGGTASAGQVAVGDGSVWVGMIGRGAVVRVDPQTNQEAGLIELGLLVLSVRTSPGAVWAAVGPPEGCESSGVVRIDPRTGDVLGRIPVACPGDLAVSPDGLWVTSHRSRKVTVIIPAQ